MLKLAWTAVDGATGYDVFMSRDSTKKKTFTPELVKTVEGGLGCTVSKLKKNTSYKAYVMAYKNTGSGKTYIGQSPLVHAFTGNRRGSYTNAKSVKLKSKAAVTLAVGGTSKIKAKVVKKDSSLKLTKRVNKLRYYTTDASIATVSEKGVITAVGGGQCKVYVIAPNGVYKAVTVTVQ